MHAFVFLILIFFKTLTTRAERLKIHNISTYTSLKVETFVRVQSSVIIVVLLETVVIIVRPCAAFKRRTRPIGRRRNPFGHIIYNAHGPRRERHFPYTTRCTRRCTFWLLTSRQERHWLIIILKKRKTRVRLLILRFMRFYGPAGAFIIRILYYYYFFLSTFYRLRVTRDRHPSTNGRY